MTRTVIVGQERHTNIKTTTAIPNINLPLQGEAVQMKKKVGDSFVRWYEVVQLSNIKDFKKINAEVK